uniref:ORF11 n=1 Tax=Malaco herpesvirus 2 TaxID=3031798 RepID=A0AA48P8W4_9VIRU|nr:TPA_asm: ORF11 [Malaco herpesvirus 2]
MVRVKYVGIYFVNKNDIEPMFKKNKIIQPIRIESYTFTFDCDKSKYPVILHKEIHKRDLDSGNSHDQIDKIWNNYTSSDESHFPIIYVVLWYRDNPYFLEIHKLFTKAKNKYQSSVIIQNTHTIGFPEKIIFLYRRKILIKKTLDSNDNGKYYDTHVKQIADYYDKISCDDILDTVSLTEIKNNGIMCNFSLQNISIFIQNLYHFNELTFNRVEGVKYHPYNEIKKPLIGKAKFLKYRTLIDVIPLYIKMGCTIIDDYTILVNISDFQNSKFENELRVMGQEIHPNVRNRFLKLNIGRCLSFVVNKRSDDISLIHQSNDVIELLHSLGPERANELWCSFSDHNKLKQLFGLRINNNQYNRNSIKMKVLWNTMVDECIFNERKVSSYKKLCMRNSDRIMRFARRTDNLNDKQQRYIHMSYIQAYFTNLGNINNDEYIEGFFETITKLIFTHIPRWIPNCVL